ncbi:MAG: c-type cytochrome [Sulfuricella sp.]
MLHRIIALIFLSLAGSFQAQAAPDGAKLYARNCAACHGESGESGIGVPLSLPSFQATVSNEYLHKTIRLGRPGRVMPASELSDADIDAIVHHIRSWNKAPAPQFSATPVKGNAEHGRALYAKQCATCHGVNGEGGEGTGVTILAPARPADHGPGTEQPGLSRCRQRRHDQGNPVERTPWHTDEPFPRQEVKAKGHR